MRDLVDMVLLIQSGTLESSRVVQALQATFGRRATHSVPVALTPPPKEWSAPFARLAAECSLELSVSEAFGIVMEFCAVLGGTGEMEEFETLSEQLARVTAGREHHKERRM